MGKAKRQSLKGYIEKAECKSFVLYIDKVSSNEAIYCNKKFLLAGDPTVSIVAEDLARCVGSRPAFWDIRVIEFGIKTWPAHERHIGCEKPIEVMRAAARKENTK